MVSSVTCMSGWMIIAEAAEESVPECLGQRKWLSFIFYGGSLRGLDELFLHPGE